MTQETIIANDSDRRAFIKFLNQLNLDKPWRFMWRFCRESRSLNQNALSHVWYKDLSDYMNSRSKTNEKMTQEAMKDSMKHMFLGYEYYTYYDFFQRKRITIERLRKTSDLDTGEMHDFLTKVYYWALDYGIMLDTPESSEFMKFYNEQSR